MKRMAGSLVMMGVWASPALAAPQQACLASGLRVVTHHTPGSQQVVVASVVEGGRRGDPEGLEGTAHLAEHLWFRARAAGTDVPVEGLLRGLAVENNAFTRIDETTFLSRGVRSDLETLLGLEAQRLGDPLAGVDDAALDLEREIVRHELAVRGVEDMSLATEALGDVLYPEGHPSRRFATQQQETLDAITLDDVRTYAETWYRPEHTTLFVVGDLPGEGAPIALAHQLLPVGVRGEGAPGPCPRAAAAGLPPEPVHQEMLVRSAYRADPTLLIAWSLPGAYGQDGPALDVIGTTAGLLLAYSAAETGLLGVYPQCDVLDRVASSELLCRIPMPRTLAPEAVRDGLLSTVDDLLFSLGARPALSGIVEQSVQRQLAVARIQQAEALGGQLGSVQEEAVAWHRLGSDASLETRLDRIGRVDPTQVMSLMRRFLVPGRAVSALLVGHELLPLSRSETASVDLPLGPPRKLAQTPTDTRPAPPAFTTLETSTGLPVIQLPGSRTDRTTAHLIFRTGAFYEDLPGQASLADWFFQPLAGRHELVRRIESLGGTWHSQNRDGHRMLGLEGLAENLEDLLGTLGEVVRGDLFQTDGRRDLLRTQLNPPRISANRLLANATLTQLMPGHPVAVAAEEGTLDATIWQTTRATRWLEGRVAPSNAALLVVGDADGPEVAELAHTSFDGWRPRKVEPPPPPLGRSLPERVMLYVPARGPRALVELSAPLPPDSPTQRPLNRAIVQAMQDRVMDLLRWQRGWTYSPSVATRVAPDGTANLVISAHVQPARAAETITLLLGALDDLATTPLTERELSDLAHRQDRQRTRALHTDDELIAVVSDAWLRDHPLDAHLQPVALVATDVQETAAIAAGHEVLGVIAPVEVMQDLDGLGIGWRVLGQ